MAGTFKKSGINNLKVLFLFHRLLYKLLEKNGGHQTNFLSGEQNLPISPHILRIIQYKTLWSVLLKKSGINNLKNLFLFHRLLYKLLEKRIKMGVTRLIFFQESKIYPYPHKFEDNSI